MKAIFRIAVFAAVIAASAVGGSLVGRAQGPAAQPDILASLLVEVRGLRAAMEQMASAGARVQLALGRVQLQEQRIGNQIRRLDAVKASLAPALKELELAEDRVKGLEEQNMVGRPPQDVRNHEWELGEAKKDLARKQSDVQRLRAEENLLMSDIAAEQNRWTDFNQRLEELERVLGPR